MASLYLGVAQCMPVLAAVPIFLHWPKVTVRPELLHWSYCRLLSWGWLSTQRATTENTSGSEEKLSPKESPRDVYTVLRGAPLKDDVSI